MTFEKMKTFVVLSVVCLSGFYSACAPFVSREKPEDVVVKLDVPLPAPNGSKRDYKIGDPVSIISNEGVFEAELN